MFCLCLQPDNGSVMICLDQCDAWFHGDCFGYHFHWWFICPRCRDSDDSVSSQAATDSCPSSPTVFILVATPCISKDFQWGDKDGDILC